MEEIELTLKKPNAALVMIPKAGKLTCVERKLFNSLLMSSISQLESRRAEGTGVDVNENYLYSAPADELLDMVEVGKSNLKSYLRKHMLSLRRAEVDWEAPDAKQGVVWSNTAVLNKAEIEIRDGRLYVRWKLSDELFEAISNTSLFPFTKLDQAQILKLTTYTSVALYEICARYRNNFLKSGDGSCLTSASDPDWWVDALTNTIPKIDKRTGLTVRRQWRKVKYEAVLKAIEEINSETDLDVELIEKKVGKAVAFVQFSVRKKRLDVRELSNEEYEVIKTGTRLGISQSKIDSALSSNNSHEVALALAKFEARVNNSELTEIENKGAFFTSLLKKVSPIDIVPGEINPAPSLQPKNNSTSVSEVEEEGYTTIKESLLALSNEVKNRYAEQALDSLKAKNMATPNMIKNASAGTWAPLLLAEMIKIYTKEQSNSKERN
jgi:hypothetical protein